jgi:signal peptidase II
MKRFTFIAALLLLADQLSKWWLLYGVSMIDGRVIEITSFFKLVMVWNHGVSFGMFNQGPSDYQPWILSGIALVISAFLVRMARQSQDRFEQLCYALIVGGALGNVIDRARFGAVADFFYFHIGELGWPAFNIADAAICIGVGLLLVSMLKKPAKP